MVFTRLVSVIMVSMIAVHAANASPLSLTIDEDYNANLKSESLTTLMAKPSDGNDRKSNWNFVIAMKNSVLWTEIKRRSMMISNQQHIIDLFEKSPDSLSDQELLELKQVCKNGLKCVAIDQLLVLGQSKQSDDGKGLICKAVTKITKVLTNYTSEYEEKYQYEAITDSDKKDKVNNSMIKIIDDNKELCQIDSNTYIMSNTSRIANATSEEKFINLDSCSNDTFQGSFDGSHKHSSNNSSESKPNENSDSALNRNSDESDKVDMSIRVINHPNGNINYGTVNNYNFTDGNTNNVTVDPKSSNVIPSNNSSKSSNVHNSPPTNRLSEQEQNFSNKPIPEADSLIDISSKNTNSTIVDSASTEVYGSIPDADASTYTDVSTSADKTDESSGINHLNTKSFFGMNNSTVDTNTLHKVRVLNGLVNIGEIKTFNYNNGTINEGVIDKSTADKGIINVGNVQNGETNYNTFNSPSNNGTQSLPNNFDTQTFAYVLSKAYSDVFERLSKK